MEYLGRVGRYRREGIVAALLLGIGLALGVLFAPLHINGVDDGLYMYQANILLHGGLPYRDYLLHDAPPGNYWHALLLWLFGNDILVLRLALIPFKAALLPAIYLLARPLVPRGPAALAALAVPIMDTTVSYWVPHVAINALALAVGAVGALSCWQRRPHPGWLVLSGLLLGGALEFKQNLGLFALAGAGLWLLEPGLVPAAGPAPGGRQRAILAGLRILAWVGVGGGTLWLVRAHLDDPGVLLIQVAPISALAGWVGLREWRARAEAGGAPVRAVIGRVLALGLGVAITTLPWLIAGLLVLDPQTLLTGLIFGPAGLANAWFAGLAPPALQVWMLLAVVVSGPAVCAAAFWLSRRPRLQRYGPLLVWGAPAVWGGGLLLWAVQQAGISAEHPLADLIGRVVDPLLAGASGSWVYLNLLVVGPALLLVAREAATPRTAHARLLLISGTLLTLEMYPMLGPAHANWCFQLLLPLAAWLGWRAAGWLQRLPAPAIQRQGQRATLVVLGLLPVLVVASWLESYAGQYIDLPASLRTGHLTRTDLVPLNLPHFHLLGGAHTRDFLQQAVSLIDRETQPGEPILCHLRLMVFYVAAERPAATSNPYASPDTTNLDEGRRLRAELEQKHVRFVLANSAIFAQPDPQDWFAQDGRWLTPARDYITANFTQTASIGDWRIWERPALDAR